MGEVAEQVENTNGESKGDQRTDTTDATLDGVIHEKIINQIEYYFSDINLSRDKFMQQQIKLDEGWVPVELLLKFRRLAAILGDRDKSVIADAIRKSSLLEVNSDDDKIRRSAEHPLPGGYDELRKELMTRTIYCKGFPLENITFDQIFEFFKSFGKVDSVIMRHFMDKATKNRGFKGSAFVTFPTVAEAEAFLKLDDVKYNGTSLVKKWQSQYIDDKRKERLEDKLTKQQRRRENKRAGKGGKSEQKSQEEAEDTEEKDERGGFPLGAVINFSGVKDGSSMQRDQIREAIESLGHSVAYIDFNAGDLSGFVRLDQGSTASQLVDKLKEESEGKLKIGDELLEVRILEGEEEGNYLDRARKEINKRRHNTKSKRKHRGGRGGHFSDRGRKRRGGHMEGPPSKSAALD